MFQDRIGTERVNDRQTVKLQSSDMRHDKTWKLDIEPKQDVVRAHTYVTMSLISSSGCADSNPDPKI